jgi:hypothetical protein
MGNPSHQLPAALDSTANHTVCPSSHHSHRCCCHRAAAGNGVALPLFSLLFGEFTQAFGSYIPSCPGDPPLPLLPGLISNDEFRSLISRIALKFVYLAIGAAALGALQQGCWTWTSNRQVGAPAWGASAP